MPLLWCSLFSGRHLRSLLSSMYVYALMRLIIHRRRHTHPSTIHSTRPLDGVSSTNELVPPRHLTRLIPPMHAHGSAGASRQSSPAWVDEGRAARFHLRAWTRVCDLGSEHICNPARRHATAWERCGRSLPARACKASAFRQQSPVAGQPLSRRGAAEEHAGARQPYESATAPRGDVDGRGRGRGR